MPDTSVIAPSTTPAQRVPENHCPLGCTMTELNELGYCHHLQGFTNTPVVGQKFEPIKGVTPAVSGHMAGDVFVDGRRRSLLTIQPTDILVNPKSREFDQMTGVEYIRDRWVSTRVYRDVPKPPPEPTEEELELLTSPQGAGYQNIPAA